MANIEQIDNEMEDLKKAMEDEYEANKESPLYWELYTKYCEAEGEAEGEAEARYDAAKEDEDYYDEYNHQPKRCIYCGAHKGEATECTK